MFTWIKSVFGASETRSLANPEAWLLELFGAVPTASGVSVTPETALRCSAAFACIKLIVELVSTLPVHIYSRTEGGGRERERDHPADRLLNGFSAPWQSGSDLRRELTLAALTKGRGLARVVKVRGQVRELHPLPGAKIDYDPMTREPFYRLDVDGTSKTLHWRDVLDVSALAGKAPIELGKEAIALALLLEEHGARLFKNGARPAGVLSIKGSINSETAKQLREAWQKAQSGENRSKTAVLGGDAEYRQLDFSSTDAEYLANRRFQTAEVARFFGVSPLLIGALEAGTFNNSEQAGLQLLTYTLSPWLRAWEHAVTRALLSEEDRKQGLYVEFLTEALTRADIAARFNAFRQSVGGPWLTANEARSADNLPAVDGGDQLYPSATGHQSGEGGDNE